MSRCVIGCGLAALLLTLLAAAAAADYAVGEAAWRRGDYAAALAQWLPLAEEGHARAQFAVGLAHEKGRGVERSAAAAAAWYRRAAARGLADAEYNLALLYLDGRGVDEDPRAAARLFRAAAERGHVPAQVNLAYSYDQGSGVEQDRTVAAAWYARAAMAGNREAWRRFSALREAGVRPAALPVLPVPADGPEAPAEDEDGTGLPVKAPERPRADPAAGPPVPPERPAAAAAWRDTTRLRLAAYRRLDNAERGWQLLAARHGTVLGSLQHRLVPVDLGERGRFLRLEAGPFEAPKAAAAACAVIRAAGDDCLVITP